MPEMSVEKHQRIEVTLLYNDLINLKSFILQITTSLSNCTQYQIENAYKNGSGKGFPHYSPIEPSSMEITSP